MRQLKEKIRGILYRLPYNIDQMLGKFLVFHAAQLINRQLSQVASDPTRSPHELVIGTKLDANAHLTHAWGERVLALPGVPSNSLQARGGDCVVIGRDDSKGQLQLWNIETNSEIHRAVNQVIKRPVDKAFIAVMNARCNPKTRFEKSVPVAIGPHPLDDLDDLPEDGGAPQGGGALVLPAQADGGGAVAPAPLVAPAHGAPVHEPEGEPEPEPAEPEPEPEPAETEPRAMDVPLPEPDLDEQMQLEPAPPLFEEVPVVEDPVSESARRLTMGGEPLFAPEPPMQPGVRRSTRASVPPTRMNLLAEIDSNVEAHVTGGRTGPKRTIELYGEDGLHSIVNELRQYDDGGCMTFAHRDDLSEQELKDARPTFMFSRTKENAEGAFIKVKSRLTSDGSVESAQRIPFENRGAPKIDFAHLAATATLLHSKGFIVFSTDDKGAYLQASQKQEEPLPIVFLKPEVAQLYVDYVDASAAAFLSHDGRLYARLNTAMYGEPNADQLWYNHLAKIHTDSPLEFEINPYDGGCLFTEDLVLCVWTDDTLGFARTPEAKEKYIAMMEERFPGRTVTHSKRFSHLGLMWDFSEPGVVEIGFSHAVDKIAALAGVKGKASTPATLDAFEVNADSPLLSQSEAAEYHKIVNTILFYASHGLWTGLFAFSILSKRVAKPTQADRVKLNRLIRYLLHTKDKPLRLRADEDRIHYHADASHLVHHDVGKGHLGAYISLGKDAPAIWAASTMVKHVTKSTAETELSAFSEKLPTALHMLRYFDAMGINLGPIIGHEDNLAAIALMQNGKPCSPRTRHLDVRAFWVKQYLDGGLLELAHEEEPASDMLTKPKVGAAFERDARTLMGWQ